MHTRTVLALDLGASSGRAMLATLSKDGIALTEAHRFGNKPIQKGDTLYWDFDDLSRNILLGLKKAWDIMPYESVGVDTWGVDFGLLGEDGCLLGDPVHYRDARTTGVPEEVFEHVTRNDLYARTGIQILPLNTLFQLRALRLQNPAMLDKASKLLFMPNLIEYILTGCQHAEYTIASTSQMLDIHTGDWDRALLKTLDIPTGMLPQIAQPGTLCGTLLPRLQRELGLPALPVWHVGSHDTASAVAAVPAAQQGNFMFLSCGTWSLLGAEVLSPVVTAESARCNMTNEGGVTGTTRLLKNIMGMWIIQELRSELERQGEQISFARLAEEAEAAEPIQGFIDPDDPLFSPPGDMSPRIKAALEKQGLPVPATRGGLARLVYESLAHKYAITVKELEGLTKQHYDTLYAVGGGIQGKLLMRLTANALGRSVQAGPIEATALGNALEQFLALGALPSLQAGRNLLAGMPEIRTYNSCS